MSTSTIERDPTTAYSRSPSTPGPIERINDVAVRWLSRYSVAVLRVSLGVVFFAFGILKFFPGASPAEALVERTIDTLTLGVIHGRTAVVITALMECFIGATLVTGKLVRTGLAVLAGALVGIMSPLVLFFSDMFPGGTPTLEAQYVFKDIVLAAAGLVIAAVSMGARLTHR
jgi:putative oxidoreductase